ncbi:class I SAM-dependent methyltransferase [Roseomonas sp. BN140053]|uniref:class I SAM-dependent methyltransferase n=1 Tax=Roseomonas sp. BN140053 TaxID=3391898 RepID=UPI0039ECC357
MGINQLKVAPWYADAVSLIKPTVSKRGTIRVLEAGGGADRFVELPDAIYTVVDISPEQLTQNSYADVKLLGDIQIFDYGDRRFDLIIFWDVLEHVAEPIAAVRRAMSALDLGGIIVIKGPLLRSTKSLMTSLTPWWFHVLYYRYVLGSNMAGKPGHAPFRTEHSKGADGDELKDLTARMGFKILAFNVYVSDQVQTLQSKVPIAFLAYSALGAALRLFTRGRYGSRETDFLLLISKPAV